MKTIRMGLKVSMIGLVCLAVSGFGTAYAEEDSPMAAGVLWGESSHVEKIAYLVGAGNFLTVEYIVQQHSDNPPTDEQSAIGRWWAGIENTSLDDLIATADAFYRDNPNQMTVPVLVVIWNAYVETD